MFIVTSELVMIQKEASENSDFFFLSLHSSNVLNNPNALLCVIGHSGIKPSFCS